MNLPTPRSTIRTRLTALYAATFFLAGAVLVVLMYVYLRQSLDQQFTARVGIADRFLVRTPEQSAPMPKELPPDLQAQLRAQFRQDRDDTLQAMLIWSLAALGGVGLIAGAFGWLLAARALQPLQQITATARRVADRSLHERISLRGPNDEIKQLADTFDAMLERLDRSFDGQRRFVANASHELRTPLTINRTLIEVAQQDPRASESLRQLGATLLHVNQRHERLIDGLLTLASSEQQLADAVAVDLADVAAHVGRESSAEAAAAGVSLRVSTAAAPVSGDPVLLERMVQNLVDNAIRYNVDGWVSVTTATHGPAAVLVVENTGPVVPPYEVDGLFEPFRRLPGSERVAEHPNGRSGGRSGGRGAGLGLSIVRSVARAHGGEAAAVPRAGGGLTVTVQLPVTASGGR